MALIDGSQTRLADVEESTIGTTPTSPAFEVVRYVDADLRMSKQTDISDEVREDRNVPNITDVGRSIEGNIRTRYQYGTFHEWLKRLLGSSWSANEIVNGTAEKSATLEFRYKSSSGTNTFTRYRGCRWNTLEMRIEARQPVRCTWGIMGLSSPAATNSALAGATYADPNTLPDINAGLNVASLNVSGISPNPKIRALTLRITNNMYASDIVGQYEADSIGLGRFEVSGSIETYFENKDVYDAIVNHTLLSLSFDLQDSNGNKEEWRIPRIYFLDGGPQAPGNGRPVMLEAPFQAKYAPTIDGTIKITRTPASP